MSKISKIIDTWSLTVELKDQIIYYFKNYDPLNSVYIWFQVHGVTCLKFVNSLV
jgi:hypothetical protein